MVTWRELDGLPVTERPVSRRAALLTQCSAREFIQSKWRRNVIFTSLLNDLMAK